MNKSKFLSVGILGFVAIFLSAFLFVSIVSCESAPPKNSRMAQAAKGKVHFQQYCVSCHGEDGTGIYIDSLNTQPANLTKLGSAKSDAFPILYVANVIDGRKMAKNHGTRTMPVWGEVFSEKEYLDESEIKGKLAEIIAYLMTIQN
jgi:mono/diheme cytochrome c family protein